MGRIVTVYGVIAGIIVIIGWNVTMRVVPDHGSAGMILGYLSMLVGLSFVFVGVKRYRDTILGGVIRFWPAFGVGLAIALIGSAFYILSWEVYMYQTNYTFMDEYVRGTIETMQASGKPAAEIAAFSKEMEGFKVQYQNPLFRMAMTFMEIGPVALLMPLISAALLRKSSFMPAREGRA